MDTHESKISVHIQVVMSTKCCPNVIPIYSVLTMNITFS